jgi:hypothetical protein
MPEAVSSAARPRSASRARAGRTRAARATTRRADRSGRTSGASTGARVRWDRLGRLAMGLVAAALLYLYLSAGIRMLSTWRQARSDSAAVVAMEHEHGLLVRQHEALGRRGTLEEEARRLGMMRKGEQQYVVTGLPDN